jgi:hypothetical protein
MAAGLTSPRGECSIRELRVPAAEQLNRFAPTRSAGCGGFVEKNVVAPPLLMTQLS